MDQAEMILQLQEAIDAIANDDFDTALIALLDVAKCIQDSQQKAQAK